MPVKSTLCMILRDESENVIRALTSVSGLYDYFVIGFDLATTDNTEALVKDFLKGQLGYYFYFRWENSFAFARNTVLDIALDRFPEAIWSMSLDGDDVLDVRSRSVVQSWLGSPYEPFSVVNSVVYLDECEYGIPSMFYPRSFLIKNDPKIRYEGASHNVLQCPADHQLLVHTLIVHHRQQPKKRAMREAQRIAMNIPNLTAAAEANQDDARPLFYKGNTLQDSGDFAGAEAAYLAYLARSTWPEERYQALLHLSMLRCLAGDIPGAEDRVWEALRTPGQWNRAEAYAHLGDCALADGRMGEALHWYSIAGEMPPPVSSLFLQGPIYTYWPHWRLTLLYDRLGMPEKAFVHAQRAYQWRPAPEIETACRVLEAQLAARAKAAQEGNGEDASVGHVEELSPELPMATQILPLPQAELERLLAEIPVGVHP